MNGGSRGAIRTRRTELQSCGSLASGVALRPALRRGVDWALASACAASREPACSVVRWNKRAAAQARVRPVPGRPDCRSEAGNSSTGALDTGHGAAPPMLGEKTPSRNLRHGPTQRPERVIASRRVVPAFDAGRGKLDIAIGHGMAPCFLCKSADGRYEFSAQGES